MPYNTDGTWLDPEDIDRTGRTCECPGCAQWLRTRGCTPHEFWLRTLAEPVFNAQGFDQFGFNEQGVTANGYDREGWDADGFDLEGRNRRGYDRDGYDRYGYDQNGRDREGYGYDGFNLDGYDRAGYDYDGFDVHGLNRDGYDCYGRDRNGYDCYGRDSDGFDRRGFDSEGYDRRGLNRLGRPRPCDCFECRLEREEVTPLASVGIEDVTDPDDYPTPVRDSFAHPGRGGWLNSYSFTPSPLLFHRKHGEDKSKTPYYGMEIEMTSDCTEQERVLGNRMGQCNELIYFKSDGSVAGFEAVTHPMTAAWARDNFPWNFVEVMAECGASVITESNGLHIHVSREGFNNESHTYRWLKFWYRNQDPIVSIAGRSGARWGSFDPDQRELHLRHAKARARVRNNPRLSQLLRSADTGHRYCALNLQNEKTIEVRLFASTTSAFYLRTRFELVAASVEYTRDLPVGKIRKGGWGWDSFLLWVDDHLTEYPSLGTFENGRILAAIEQRNQAHEPVLTLS